MAQPAARAVVTHPAARAVVAHPAARAAPPRFAAQTADPDFHLAYPPACRPAPLTKGALLQRARCGRSPLEGRLWVAPDHQPRPRVRSPLRRLRAEGVGAQAPPTVRTGEAATSDCGSGFSRDRGSACLCVACARKASRLKPLLQQPVVLLEESPLLLRGRGDSRGDRQGRSRGPKFAQRTLGAQPAQRVASRAFGFVTTWTSAETDAHMPVGAALQNVSQGQASAPEARPQQTPIQPAQRAPRFRHRDHDRKTRANP